MESHHFVLKVRPRCLNQEDIQKSTDKLFIVLFIAYLLVWLSTGVSDSRPNQVIEHQNPVEKYREPTDKIYYLIYPIIILIWVIICIIGFVTTQIHDINGVNEFLSLYINAPIQRFSLGFILSVIICIVVVCLCAFLTLKFPKFFVNVGLGLFILGTIGYIYEAIMGTAYGLATIRGLSAAIFRIASVLYTWFSAIFMICAAYWYLKADKNELCGITKDAYQTFICRPSLVIFACLITVLSALIFSFTFNALIYDIFALRGEFLTELFLLVILYGGACALTFLPLLAVMVITDYTVNNYWKKHENTSPSIGHSIVNALRNHIGTIMFASTAFVASIFGIIQAVKHKRSWENKENSISYIVTKIYLAVRMPEIAVIFTAIYGTDYVKSAQTAFDVILRRCPLYLATIAACEGVICIPLFLATIASLITLVVDPIGDPQTFDGMRKLFLIIHGLLYPLICYIALVWLTMKALLINKIIMLNKEEQDTQGKVHILNRP